MTLCEKCQQLMDGFLNEDLNDEEAAFFNQHIAECADCRQELGIYCQLVKELAVWAETEVTPPPDFRVQLMDKLAIHASKKRPKSLAWLKHYSPRLLPVALAAVLMIALLPSVLHSNDKTMDKFSGGSFLLDEAPWMEGQAMLFSVEKQAVNGATIPPSPTQASAAASGVSEMGTGGAEDRMQSAALPEEDHAAPKEAGAQVPAPASLLGAESMPEAAPDGSPEEPKKGRSRSESDELQTDWTERLSLAQENLTALEAQKEAMEAKVVASPTKEGIAELEALVEEIKCAEAILKAVEEKDVLQYEELTRLND